MNTDVIRLLLIEDNVGDARLVQESLKESHYSKAYNLVSVDRLVKGDKPPFELPC
jgi:hypothetical protein